MDVVTPCKTALTRAVDLICCVAWVIRPTPKGFNSQRPNPSGARVYRARRTDS